MTVLLTLVLLVYGYVAMIIPELGAPFIAVILIYFLWKDKANKFDREKEIGELKNELADIKKLLSNKKTQNIEKDLQDKDEESKDK